MEVVEESVDSVLVAVHLVAKEMTLDLEAIVDIDLVVEVISTQTKTVQTFSMFNNSSNNNNKHNNNNNNNNNNKTTRAITNRVLQLC